MLSFDDNLHVHSLPPFANETNKAISEDIKSKETRLASLSAVYDDNITRTESMVSHMRNVQQELVHTQALYDAKIRQIETEDHLKQVAEREGGRLNVEIKRVQEDISSNQDSLTSIQSNIYRISEKMEGERHEFKFSKEELEEWIRVQTEKEEDTQALLKYSKEDEAKIKQLTLMIEKLMHEVQKKKNALSTEVTETQVSQIELDKTTEEFKLLHLEREELIGQWETAIKAMNKRDQDIEESQTRFQSLKGKIKHLQSVIDEKQGFLDQQLEVNAETERKIGACDRSVSKYRLEQTEAIASLAQFQDEVDVIRNTLNKTATDLINKRAEIANLKTERLEKQSRLERENKNKMDIKATLARVTDQTMTMEAKAQELQNILKHEESRSKELDRDLKILREQQFKKNQQLFKLKQDEKNFIAEVAGAEASTKSLQSKIMKLDQEALKQQALLYSQEFQIQQLERKVRRAQGDRTDEEKEVLQKRITELNEKLDSHSKKWTLLNVQLKKSQEDLRQAKRKLETLTKQKGTVTQSIDELNLYNESAASQLALKIKEKEDAMVEENLLKLELRKLRGFLNARADEVFSLETRQLQLHLALEERGKEIGIHKEMLRVQIKNAEEERYSACAELRDRVGKVEKLKRRYEILMSQFAPSSGDEAGASSGVEEGADGDHSQAYYVIRAAQQREELQREGDELDAKIRKAEKEIKALENTLRLMNDRNEEYRMNIYKSELNKKDVQHQEMLNEQYRSTMEVYKQKREELQDLQIQLNSLEKTLSIVTSDESTRMQAIQVLELKLTTVKKELNEQALKRERASKMYIKLSKEYMKLHPVNGEEPKENEELTDIKVRAVKERCNMIMAEMEKIQESHPELSDKISEYYQNHNILAPSKPVSRAASRTSSIRGGNEEDNSETSSNAGDDYLSRSSSRLSQPYGSSGILHGRNSTSNSAMSSGTSTPRRVSTNNLNANVTLPNPLASSSAGVSPRASISGQLPGGGGGGSRGGSQRNLAPQQASISIVSPMLGGEDFSSQQQQLNAATGPITGSDRIKRPVRRGSNASVSSKGSASSLK